MAVSDVLVCNMCVIRVWWAVEGVVCDALFVGM